MEALFSRRDDVNFVRGIMMVLVCEARKKERKRERQY